LLRQRVLRRMDARAGRGDGNPESVATMLRYYLPLGKAHARRGAMN